MTVLVALIQTAKATQWEPGLVAGYASLALSIIALITYAISYGKWLEKLNGVGKRVHELETESTIAKAERSAQEKATTRLLDQHEQMLVQLGEAKRDTVACREDTEVLGIRIGTAVTELTREVSEMHNELSNRLTRVETILNGRTKT